MRFFFCWLAVEVCWLGCGEAFPVRSRLVEQAETQMDYVRKSPLLKQLLHYRKLKRLRQHRHKINMVKEAMVYLRSFDYLVGDLSYSANHISRALVAFQKMAGLPATGELNHETIEQMRRPRCGNSDFPEKHAHTEGEQMLKRRRRRRFAGWTVEVLESAMKQLRRRRKRFIPISAWSEKYSKSARSLTLKWFIEKYTTDIPEAKIKEIVTNSFKLWSNQVNPTASELNWQPLTLSFEEAASSTEADINIKFAEGEHGDAYPFDGLGSERNGKMRNVLAHTFYPKYPGKKGLNGDIHLDDAETWLISGDGSAASGVHFPYVLVHEIGHALGLGHSNMALAVMNPIYKQQALDAIKLHIDDQCAVHWNYDVPGDEMVKRCTFLWLLIELLPLAHKNGTTVNHTTDLNDFEMRSKNGLALKRKIDETLANFTDIPQCRGKNNVQIKYEELLENKLGVSRENAKRYGPVMCRFLDGLARIVDVKQRTDEVALMTVHSYAPMGANGADQALLDELSSSEEDMLGDSLFNEQFYRHLLALILNR